MRMSRLLEAEGNRRKPGRNSYKGFVLTLDAMMALLVIFVSIAAVFGFMQQVSNYSHDSANLRELSSGLLSVMEKNDYLRESLSDRNVVITLLGNTPEGVCMMLEVTEGNSTTPVYAVEKSGCEEVSSAKLGMREEDVSWRSFVKDGAYYSAKMTSWYR